MLSWFERMVTRRLLLGAAAVGGSVPLVRLAVGQGTAAHHAQHSAEPAMQPAEHARHGGMVTVGEVDYARNGFDPHAMLTDWDRGTVSKNGRAECTERVCQ